MAHAIHPHVSRYKSNLSLKIARVNEHYNAAWNTPIINILLWQNQPVYFGSIGTRPRPYLKEMAMANLIKIYLEVLAERFFFPVTFAVFN